MKLNGWIDLMIDHLGGGVGVWLSGGGLGERNDLMGISPDNGGLQSEKFTADIEVEGGGGGSVIP